LVQIGVPLESRRIIARAAPFQQKEKKKTAERKGTRGPELDWRGADRGPFSCTPRKEKKRPAVEKGGGGRHEPQGDGPLIKFWHDEEGGDMYGRSLGGGENPRRGDERKPHSAQEGGIRFEKREGGDRTSERRNPLARAPAEGQREKLQKGAQSLRSNASPGTEPCVQRKSENSRS